MRKFVKKRIFNFFLVLLNFKTSLVWLVESLYMRHNLSVVNNSFVDLTNCLVVAPHSDDEWIGCFLIIEEHQCNICLMNMDGGNDIGTKENRCKEAIQIANKYNNNIDILGDNKLKDLKNVINKKKPDVICIPYFIDWHEEHIIAMQILNEAIKDYDCKILMYQVSCPLPKESVNYVIPLNKEQWRRKWNIFRSVYKTQVYFPWKRFALIEKAEGGYSNSYAANVYCIMEKNDWRNCFYLLLDDKERKEIQSHLGNIKKTFIQINKYYQSHHK